MSGPLPSFAGDPAGWRASAVGGASLGANLSAGLGAPADAELGSGDDCGAMVAKLYEFLDGELTEQRRYLIQAHLEACPSCFSAFDFEAELRIVIQQRVRAQVPLSLVDRVRRALAEES